LFAAEEPGVEGDYLSDLNPDSLEVLTGCKLEPSLADLAPGETVQFERLGYFCRDADAGVFNRTLSLRDTWAKAKSKG
jgi:glutaminyl-tRNA synthetase